MADSTCETSHEQSKSEPLLADSNSNNHTSLNGNVKDTTFQHDTIMNVEIEAHFESERPMIYGVSKSPPLHLLFVFGLQQALLAIASPLITTMIVSEAVCAQNDDAMTTQILSATFFMSGLSTFFMSTFGVRLPVFQGPANSYLIPLIAMKSLKEWKCPETLNVVDPVTNSSMVMALIDNGTMIPRGDFISGQIAKLSGSLMLAGFFHFFIGMTGTVGILMRYIGPVTVVPTIVLVGLYIFKVTVKFSETSWLVAAFTSGMGVTLSLFLSNKQTPIPLWNKSRGWHILWYPLHQVFSILLSILAGWMLSAILTSAGYYSDDPDSKEFLARTDSRTEIIHETEWFVFPYPGKLSGLSLNAGVFVSFFISTLLSVLDSIGDYNATARTAHTAPVPKFAFNRGIAVEGLMSMISGSMGCCHATVSYGSNIGAIGITKVSSRRVFQLAGILFIIFAILGKVGAIFITIPYSVLGGCQIVTVGIFIGVVMSYLEVIDLRSTRNLAIIGMALLLGLMLPYWVQKTPQPFDTGFAELDQILSMLLSNPSFVGGAFSFSMDNLVPGTLKERGLQSQLEELYGDDDPKQQNEVYEDGPEIYRLPGIPNSFRKTRCAKFIPVIEYMGPK